MGKTEEIKARTLSEEAKQLYACSFEMVVPAVIRKGINQIAERAVILEDALAEKDARIKELEEVAKAVKKRRKYEESKNYMVDGLFAYIKAEDKALAALEAS